MNSLSNGYASLQAAKALELENRIKEFKDDEENMQVVRKFVDEVVLVAEEKANRFLQQEEELLRKRMQELMLKPKPEQEQEQPEEQQGKQEDSGKSARESKAKSPKASFSEFNNQMGNLARVYVVRMFDAICNCANNAAAAPIPRFKFRNNKKTTTTETNTNANANTNSNHVEECNEEKIKKTDSNKFKSDLLNSIKLTKKSATNGKMKKSDKSNKTNKLSAKDVNHPALLVETIEMKEKN